jgi:hypothetical protein
MKLNQIAAKPQLIKMTLEDDAILAEFGEAIEFWTWDRQPLETFMKLANSNQADVTAMIGVVRTLILDESGKEIITGEVMLPSHILIKVIARIVDTLGK